MICQNCNKNEATMHMKRIINGRAAEVHLCSDCARFLGYGEAFSGFSLSIGDLLGEMLGKGDNIIGGEIRCPFCGKSFEEIAEDGKMGCAECYSVFYDRILPSLQRIHGKASYAGQRPSGDVIDIQSEIKRLKAALNIAVQEQNFELAAELRDKINSLISEGGKA